MAKRFYSEFTSIHNIDYIVEIHDSDFVGSAQPFALGAGGFSLSYAGDNNERWATIFASQIEFTFYVENAFHISFEQALIINTEGRFSVKVFREGSLYWVGQILPDIVEILDQPTVNGRPMVIKATDGLGRLKDIDYNNNGSPYTGTATLIEQVFNILGKIDILSLMATDCVKTSVGWREDSMTTGDQLALTRVKHKAFIQVDEKGVLSYKNCADALKEILLKFNARIVQVDGCFYIIQVGQYVANSMMVYAYDSTGTGTGSASSQVFQQTDDDNTGDMIRLSGGRFTYYPALRYVRIDYKHFTAQNVSEERDLNIGTPYTIFNVPSVGNTTTFAFSFQIQNKIEFDDPAEFQYLNIKFRATIRVGGFYYQRKAIINERGAITYQDGTWVAGEAYYEFFATVIETDGESVINEIEFVTNGIPDTGDVIVGVSFEAYYTLLGQVYSIANLTRTTSISDFYVEVVVNGVIKDRVITTQYEVLNTNTTSSVGLKLESIIGDGPSDTTYGAFEVYNGSAWVYSDNWTGLGETTPTPLLRLLASELMSGQSIPTQKIESLWEATGYKANMSILYASENYLPIQCRLDANRDDWSGEFFAVRRTLSDADPQTPVDKYPSGQLPRKRVDINREIPPAGPIVEPVVRQLGVLYVRDTGVIPFTSGDTVGNIPIPTTDYPDTFLDGDPVYLVNGLTGQIQRFEVSGDVPVGATFLNVVPESADFDIIPGAIIIPDYGFQANRINSGGGSSYFNQEWDNHMSATLTWTENGGVLPATNTKAQIQLFQGQSKLREAVHYTISGSNFLINANVHYDGAYYEAIVVI